MSSKKDNKKTLIFVGTLILIAVVIVGIIIYKGVDSLNKEKNRDDQNTSYSSNESNLNNNTPSLSEKDKKDITVNLITSLVDDVRGKINNMEYTLEDLNSLNYYPVNIENINDMPLGKWNEAYVVVSIDLNNFVYNYYFTFYDENGYGMNLTKYDDLSTESIIMVDNKFKDTISKQIIDNYTSTIVIQNNKEETNKESALKNLTYEELMKKASNNEKFFVEVIQSGCGYCEEFTPRLDKVLKDNNIEGYQINITIEGSNWLNEYKISGTPTIIFFENGNYNLLVGAASDTRLINELRNNGYIK